MKIFWCDETRQGESFVSIWKTRDSVKLRNDNHTKHFQTALISIEKLDGL